MCQKIGTHLTWPKRLILIMLGWSFTGFSSAFPVILSSFAAICFGFYWFLAPSAIFRVFSKMSSVGGSGSGGGQGSGGSGNKRGRKAKRATSTARRDSATDMSTQGELEICYVTFF